MLEQIEKYYKILKASISSEWESDDLVIRSIATSMAHLENMNSRLNKNPEACYQDRVFMASRSKFVSEVENGYKMLGLTAKQRAQVTTQVDALSNILG